MKVLAILVLCVAVASAGRITHTNCASQGVLHEVRIDNHPDAATATMQPGTQYRCHGDITPRNTHTGLKLKVTVTYLGIPIVIIDTTLPNSAVTGGARYTVSFNVTPNDQISGSTVPIKMETAGEAAGAVIEGCGTIQVRIQ